MFRRERSRGPVRAEDLEHPDELRVDLDPVPGVAFPQVRKVAMAARGVLEEHKLAGWPKTSGRRGIHVALRIKPQWTYEVRRSAPWPPHHAKQRGEPTRVQPSKRKAPPPSPLGR